MRRILLVVLACLVVVLAGGFLALGAFPPHAAGHAVHVVLPNDRLAPA